MVDPKVCENVVFQREKNCIKKGSKLVSLTQGWLILDSKTICLFLFQKLFSIFQGGEGGWSPFWKKSCPSEFFCLPLCNKKLFKGYLMVSLKASGFVSDSCM